MILRVGPAGPPVTNGSDFFRLIAGGSVVQIVVGRVGYLTSHVGYVPFDIYTLIYIIFMLQELYRSTFRDA